MKITKKLLVLLFALVVAFVCFGFVNTNAKGYPVSDKIQVLGAGIRTTGNAGMRFKATVKGLELEEGRSISKYGILFAYGEETDFYKGDEVNGLDVLFCEVDTLDEAEEEAYYVTIYGVPEDEYFTNVTTRAYVVLDDETIIYGSDTLARNLVEVALKASNDGVESELIAAVKESANADYMKFGVNAFGKSVVSNLYENDYAKLKTIFVEDFNATCGTALTTSSSYSAYTTAMYGTKNGTGSSNVDITDGNLYKFFNDTEMKAKWGWLIDYLDTFKYAHLNNQIKALKGDGTKDGCGCEYGLYQGLHLVETLYNFFNNANQVGYPTKGFPNESDYNSLNQSVIYADLSLYDVYKVGDKLLAPVALEKYGYIWDGWTVGGVKYQAGDEYTVTSSKAVFEPTFVAGTFTISYEVNGGTLAGGDPTEYTFGVGAQLKSPSKEGAAFAGWYDNPDFEGAAIAAIPTTLGENITLYAKFNSEPVAKINTTNYYTLSSALEAAVSGDVIEVMPGIYGDNITITKSNITLQGPNYNIDPNTGTRGDEAIISGTITLASSLSNISIKGFKFIDNACVTVAKLPAASATTYNTQGFNFEYNVVDKGQSTNRIVDFDDNDRIYNKNIVIKNNNVTAPKLEDYLFYFVNNDNIDVENNVFTDVNGDVIVTWDSTNGAGTCGDIYVINNEFYNIKGSALWFNYTNGGTGSTKTMLIKDNLFNRVDGGACIDFESASKTATFKSARVIHNTFIDVWKCFWGAKWNVTVTMQYNVIYADDTTTGPSSGSYFAKNDSSGTSNYVTAGYNYFASKDGQTVYTTNASSMFGAASTKTNGLDSNNFATIEALEAAYAIYNAN